MEDEEEPEGMWVSEGEARTVGTDEFRNSMITDPIVRLTLGPPANPSPRDMQLCQKSALTGIVLKLTRSLDNHRHYTLHGHQHAYWDPQSL